MKLKLIFETASFYYSTKKGFKKMQASVSDIELTDRIKTGDYQAFRILFERYYSMLCNFSTRYVADDFVSEDVVQEVFAKIWEDRKKMTIRDSVKSYLFSAVRNQSLNRIKSENIRSSYNSDFVRQIDIRVTEVEIENEEFRNYLFQCIDKLPPRCREVFEKSRFEDMKQEKIASSLDISIKTVKAQIGKALQLIRSCLEISYPEFL